MSIFAQVALALPILVEVTSGNKELGLFWSQFNNFIQKLFDPAQTRSGARNLQVDVKNLIKEVLFFLLLFFLFFFFFSFFFLLTRLFPLVQTKRLFPNFADAHNLNNVHSLLELVSSDLEVFVNGIPSPSVVPKAQPLFTHTHSLSLQRSHDHWCSN